MVKAIRIHEFGGPDVLKWEDIEVGDPGPGQLRLRHTVSGFNFLDIMVRKGLYPVLPELPSVLGTEAAAVIEAVGAGVDGFSVGQRVVYAATMPGAYAEARLIDATQVVAIPDGIADDLAAASMLKGMTAEYLIHRTFAAQSGQTALVHAAAGGVGLFLCQWLAAKGVTVIGTVGSDAKKETILANGAAHAVNYKTENFTEAARDVTGGEGVHVVYDSVGKDHYQGSIDSLRRRGMMINFGNASGPVPPIDAVELNVKGSLFFTKASMRFYQLSRAELENSAATLFDAIGSGAVKPFIGQTYALADAAQAHIDVWDGKTTGSTVLSV
ncbi:MAG: quinone oxidoreductase [Rhodospirillaceae bacterium]|jgi:NADPH2:quinone reductase|nr:quinone oxidoreductase [Rhodospirillaceae bacterium]MBT4773988.1 quinone oxidoreductase [Rhodospirillaceae bacterium]MBT5357556.1 quinone oxidoreductase [Rhodospirillaceae bacterium]MBT5770545.1 quinone oxidoreductase [Rhodospirillaceae bacterium]MBT6308977.1 quinone oxidoreductase [Rhodospirillaceae bacterium]